LGIPVPETYAVRTVAEALEISEKLAWPVVLKPTLSAKLHNGKNVESFNVSYANTTAELRELMAGYEGRCTVLMQEYFQGVGYGVELLMDKGREIAAFAHKRIREIPITGGASAYRESVKLDDTLYQQSLDFLKELQWTGLAMVEFKVRNNEARLMEINGRIWGSLPLAVASGVNFPLLLTRLYLDGPDSVRQHMNEDYKTGIFCRDLQRDLMWIVSVLGQRKKYPFLKVPRRVEAVKALAALFNPMTKSDLFSLDDPLPAFAEIPRILQKFQDKVRAH
jgi:predicted ATP-grasp superfamily ATP-dependent carboligase